MTNEIFNHSLYMYKAGITTYSNYNNNILESGATIKTINNY